MTLVIIHVASLFAPLNCSTPLTGEILRVFMAYMEQVGCTLLTGPCCCAHIHNSNFFE